MLAADRERHVGHAVQHHRLVPDADQAATTGSPSTISSMPPNSRRFSPVAVMITSASSCAPDQRPGRGERLDVIGHDLGLPGAERVEEVAVGGQAQPLVPRVVRGGEVRGHVIAVGQALADAAAEHGPGRTEHYGRSWYRYVAIRAFFHRIAASRRPGSTARSSPSITMLAGSAIAYEGERSTMVTVAACAAIAGTSVTAVAPLPITTRWPVRSRSSGQSCGWTTRPVKLSQPAELGVASS